MKAGLGVLVGTWRWNAQRALFRQDWIQRRGDAKSRKRQELSPPPLSCVVPLFWADFPYELAKWLSQPTSFTLSNPWREKKTTFMLIPVKDPGLSLTEGLQSAPVSRPISVDKGTDLLFRAGLWFRVAGERGTWLLWWRLAGGGLGAQNHRNWERKVQELLSEGSRNQDMPSVCVWKLYEKNWNVPINWPSLHFCY